MRKYKYDKMIVGVALGILLPSLFIFIFYLVNYSFTSFAITIEHYYEVGRLSALLSLSLLVNLALFFILYKLDYEMAPRGLILATFLWGIAIVYFKIASPG